MVFVGDKAKVTKRGVRRIGRRAGKADFKLTGKLYFMDKAKQIIRRSGYVTGHVKGFVRFYAA